MSAPSCRVVDRSRSRTLTGNRRRAAHDRGRPLQRRLFVEVLEDRRLLSSTTSWDPTEADGESATNTADKTIWQLPRREFSPEASFLYVTDGYLTAPSSAPPLQIAMDYLTAQADPWGVTAGELGAAIVTDLYTDADTGLTHIYLRQQVDGLEVANANLNVNVTADGRILSIGGGFVPGLAGTATDSDYMSSAGMADLATSPAATSLVVTPELTAPEALALAASALGYTVDTAPTEVLDAGSNSAVVSAATLLTVADVLSQRADDAETTPEVTQATTLLDSDLSLDPIPAQLHYVATREGLQLAWDFVLRTPDNEHWYEASVDAASGRLLVVADWVDDASYNVFARPVETPADGSRTVVTDPHDTTASPLGWHDTNGTAGAEYTDTRGNNVFAQEDRDNNNSGGYRPSGGSSLNFNFALDLSQAPLVYQDAAITNLFYWNNVSHDIHYRYGFTEAAGNFQVNNYGRGGTGNDAVQADAQDGSGTDNANFATPPEGTAPRMQMFVFTFTTPNRDGDLASEIIVHEYGHGVSNRLVGGPSNVTALDARQSGGMGEGWSDWWGLMFTQKSSDTQNGSYPVGNYVIGESPTGGGIRRYPYSYNMAVDPLTYGSYNGGWPNYEVHNSGEIWCSVLWDLNWLLINKYGFNPDISGGYTGSGDAGNILALKLVMNSLKLLPVYPTFLDGRDAMLQADQVLTGGANRNEIWQAFARRGMGYSADDGGHADATTIVEAFDLPSADPVVTSQTPNGAVFAAPNYLQVHFSEAMNTSSFAVANDVQSFTGPGGVNLKPQITGFSWIDSQTLKIDFSTQTTAGAYLMTVGPQILAADNGNPMDENRNGTPGEAGDAYAASFTFQSGVGPDAFGYVATAYPYESLDLAPGGAGVTTILDGTDDGYAPIPLGTNTLRFYGVEYTGSNQLYVGANGVITLGSGTGDWSNTDLTSVPSDRTIAPLWDDWVTNLNSTDAVLYKFDGNRLIVEWNQVEHYGSSVPVTFQTILQLNTTATNASNIIYNYPDLDAGDAGYNNGASATVGIKDAGIQTAAGNRLLVSMNDGNNPLVATGSALRIIIPGSIAGTVFNDLDGDSTQDSGEGGLTGWTVYADTNNSGTFETGEPSATSDSSGSYTLGQLPWGTYTVREVVPNGWTRTTPAGGSHIITLASGQNVPGVLFGNRQAAAQPARGVYIDDVTATVHVFDVASDTLLGTVALPGASGNSTLDVVITPDQSLAFVSEFEARRVWVVDMNTIALAAGTNPIPVSPQAEDMDITPDGRFLLVVDGGSSDPISVVDIAARSQVSTYLTGTYRNAVAAGAGGNVLVADWGAGAVRRLSLSGTGTLTDTGQALAASTAFNVILAPDGQTGIVMKDGSGGMQSFVVSGMTAVDSRALLGGESICGVFSPTGDRFFARTAGGTVSAWTYNPATGQLGSTALYSFSVGTANTFFGVDQLDISPDGTKLYVTENTAVRVYNAASGGFLTALTNAAHDYVGIDLPPMPPASPPTQVARGVYIDDNTSLVHVFDPATDTLLGTVPLPTTPSNLTGDVVITPDLSLAFVSDFQGQRIWVVDLNTISLAAGTNPIPVSPRPEDLDITPDGRFLLVADGSNAGDPISVVDIAARTQVSTLAPGSSRSAIAVSSGGNVLVSDYTAGLVRRLTLSASGTLSDTGQTVSASQPNNVVFAPNGLTAVAVNWAGYIQSFVVSGMAPVASRSSAENLSGAFSPSGDRFYVRSYSTVTAWTYDQATGQLGSAPLYSVGVSSGSGYFGIEQLDVSPDGSKVYVTGNTTVKVLNAATGALLTSFTNASHFYVGIDVAATTGSSDSGQIRGMKWNDLDGDGVKDSGEPGLSDWTIYLDENRNGVLDTGEVSTTTGSDGSYVLSGLPAGSYTVAEVLQTGWQQTYPNAVAAERVFAVRVSGTAGTIYEINPSDGSVLHSFPLPAPLVFAGPQGLALGPSSLFYLDGSVSGPHTLWELNPDTGAVIDSDVVDSAAPASIAGIGYLNGKVYLEQYNVDRILVWDPVADVAVTTLSVSADLIGGLAGAADLGLLFDSNGNGQIFAINPTTGGVVRTLNPGVGALTGGLAYYQGALYAAPYSTPGTVYRIDPNSGQVLGTLTLGGSGYVSGLGSDGVAYGTGTVVGAQRLFVVPNDSSSQIAELDPATGAELRRFAAPESTSSGPDGLAFDGTSLYFINGFGTDVLWRLNPDTGAVLDSDLITGGSGNYDGLAALDGKIYILDFGASSILEFDPATGSVPRTLNVPTTVGGGLAAITGPNALLATVGAGAQVAEIDPATGQITRTMTLSSGNYYGVAAVDGQIFVGGLNSRIDVYSRTGVFQRSLTTTYAVWALGGDDTGGSSDVLAHAVVLQPGEVRADVDFGNRASGGGTVDAEAGGPYTIAEGQGLTLDASGSIAGPNAVYDWDLDGDGDFADGITGQTPTVTWAALQALGIGDGPYTGTVQLRVTDPDGGGGTPVTRIYVAERDPADGIGGRIEVFDTDLNLVQTIDHPSFDSGVLQDVEVGPTGDLFVGLDTGSTGQILRFQPDGTLVGTITLPPGPSGGAYYPYGFDVAADGTFYVAPQDTPNTVFHVAANGALLGTLATSAADPHDVAVAPGGSIFVSNGAAASPEVGLNLRSDGNYWIARGNAGDVQLRTPSGTVLATRTLSPYTADPEEDPAGNLYVTRYDTANSLRKFDAAGNVVRTISTTERATFLAVATVTTGGGGGGVGVVFADDFDPTIEPGFWTAVDNGVVGTVSGTTATNVLYFDGNGARDAATKDMNVAGGGQVQFSLRIGTDTGPWENADVGEEVVLEYSTNAGGSWTVVRTYNVDSYPTFTTITEAIPAGAQTAATRFRWRQISNSGLGWDNWGIDDVQITASGGGGGTGQELLLNGSFETGDFSGWQVADLSSPFYALRVAGAGLTPGFSFFTSAPTDGNYAALHGFDGNGPGTIRIAQQVAIPDGTTTLTFDYRVAWNLTYGATLDRLLDVNLETLGGTNLLNVNVLRADAGTVNLDTGNLQFTLDVSAFAGNTVRLALDSFVPQANTGPAFMQIDNVSLMNVPSGGGGIDYDTATLTINNVAPEITSFNVPPGTYTGGTVNLSATATDPAGAADPLTYTWTITRPNSTTFTVSGPATSFVAAAGGVYGVALTVSDGDGGTDTASATTTAASTLVELTGNGDLRVVDLEAGGQADNLTISYQSLQIVITDPVHFLSTAIPGATGGLTHTVQVPRAAVTNAGGDEILVATLAGGDSLTVDSSLTATSLPLFYDGGGPAGAPEDTLRLTGSATRVQHVLVTESTGSVDLDGYRVTYTGLEPIVDNLSAVDRVFSFTGGAETITLSDDSGSAANVSFIGSSLSESVTFVNPTGSLTVETNALGGSGTDTINVQGLDGSFNADLTIRGDSDDTVRFQTNATDIHAGDLRAMAGAIQMNQQVTTSGLAVLTALTGAISDGNGAAMNLIASAAVLSAAAGVGAAGDPLETGIDNLEGSAGSGFFVSNNKALTIGGVSAGTGITATGGDIEVSSQGPMVVNEEVRNSGGGKAMLSTVGSGGGPLPTVAVLGSPSGGAGWNSDVRAKLLGTGLLAAVDTYIVGGAGAVTPTLAQLQAYDSVLVYSDAGGFLNATALGNNVADYVDSGAGVVTQTFAFSIPLAGRWSSGGYSPLQLAGQSQDTPLSLGTVFAPGHPVLQGVASFNGGTSSFHNTGASNPNALVVANWSNGRPLVVDLSTFNAPIIGLNFYPPSSDVRNDFWVSSTDGDLLMANALVYAAGAVNGGDADLTLNANVTATSGSITLNAADDILQNSGTVSAAGSGAVDYNAGTDTADGVITMADGTQATSGSGPITLGADGDITVTGVSTGGIVQITSGAGSVIQGGNTNTDVAADALAVSATAGAIGASGSPLAMAVTTLTTVSGGGQFLSEADTLTIGIGDLNAGSATVTLSGGTFLTTDGSTPLPTTGDDGDILSPVTVAGGAVLGGTGTVTGSVAVAAGGMLQPGQPLPGDTTGRLTVGPLSLADSSSQFQVQLGGLAAGAYDQVNADGAPLGNATLTVSLVDSFLPDNSTLQSFTIIDNRSIALVGGTFNGLPEGAALTASDGVNTRTLYISYRGGDGNDVVLNTQPVFNGTPGADTYRITGDGTNFTVELTVFVGNVGGAQATSTTTLNNPPNITFNGWGGDDLLIVEYSATSTDAIPAGGVFYNGGSQDFTSRAPNSLGDVLRVIDTRATHTLDALYLPDGTVNPALDRDGQVVIAGAGGGTVHFAQLEPTDLSGWATTTVRFANNDDDVDVTAGFDSATGTTNPALVITGTSGGVPIESLHVWDTDLLVIDTTVDEFLTPRDGNDQVDFVSGNNAHAVDRLSVQTGNGTDLVRFLGSVVLTGDAAAGTADAEIDSQAIAFDGGQLTVSAANGLADLDAGSGAISTTTSAVDVQAVNLVAQGDAGVTLDTDVTNVEADGGTGGVDIEDSNALVIGGIGPMVGVSASGGNIVVTANGALTVDEEVTNSGGGDVTLTAATGGAPGDDLTVNANVTASGGNGNVALSAADDILQSAGTVSAAGSGAVDYTAGTGTTDGVITMADGTQAISGTGAITMDADGDVTLGSVNTGNGTAAAVSITSTSGGVVDGGDTHVDIITNAPGAQVTISAVTGIGSANALETMIDTLDAVNTGTGGDIQIYEVAPGAAVNHINVNQLSQSNTGGNGNILLTTEDGDINIISGESGVTIDGSGHVTLRANADTATGPAEAASARGSIDVDDEITTAGGDITLSADHDITGDVDGDISSGGTGTVTITADANNDVPDSNNNGTIQLKGDLNAGAGDVKFSLADCDGSVGETPAGGANGRVTAANIVMGNDLKPTAEGVLRLQAGTGGANNNTFSGTTTVVQGTLIVNGVLTDTDPATPTASGSDPFAYDVIVQSGGVLGGHGNGAPGSLPFPAPTTGVINASITVESGGVLEPGDVGNGCAPQTGVLTVNPGSENVEIQPGGTFRVQLAGLSPGATSGGYDQLVLNGTGDLNGIELDGSGGGTLLVQPQAAIPVGAKFVIVSKLPAGDWDTRFLDRPEGGFFWAGPTLMNISYFASDTERGDGANNDITLTAPGRYDFNGFGGHTETDYMGVSPFQEKAGNTAGWVTAAPYYLPWYFERGNAADPGWDALRYDGQTTNPMGDPLRFQVDVVAAQTYEVMILTGDASWNHDRESFTVTGSPAGNSDSAEINVWGAGAPDGSGAQVTWGGGTANPSSGYYRWVRLTVTVGGTAGAAGTITLDMDDLGGSSGTTVILALDIRPADAVGKLTLVRAADPADTPPFDVLPADGMTVDTYTGTGAPPYAVLTVTVSAGGHYATVTPDSVPDPDVPATPNAYNAFVATFGGQVKADAAGAFEFQVRRPATLTVNEDAEDWTMTVEESSGLSRGSVLQPYAAPSQSAALRFDFGTATSPLQTDFLQVVPQTIYNATRGYGWLNRVAAGDRRDNYDSYLPATGHNTASPLRTDFNSGRNATFKVDVPDGTYSVRLYHSNPLYFGSVPYTTQPFQVRLEGSDTYTYTVDAIAPGTTHVEVLTGVAVSDGALDILFGYNNTSFMIAGIDISAGSPPGESPLLASGDPLDAGAAAIGLTQLQRVAAEAAARWSAVGLTAQQATTLANVQFAVADLGGACLGLANPATNTVRIDDDAARMGWSVIGDRLSVVGDRLSVVGDRLSVIGDRLPITDYRSPITGVDLLTVVMHELGHLLGYGHSADAEDLMAPVLAAGRAGSFQTLEPLGRAEWGTGPASLISEPSSRSDAVFADFGRGGGEEPSSALPESNEGEDLTAAAVRPGEEATQAKVPRRSRLQRHERELDDWFAQLAAELEGEEK